MQAVRPGLELSALAVHDDEVVLAGGQEVFRLPLSPDAAARHAVLVRALPELRTRVPLAVAVPRYIGVMADGATPFTAERRLPGSPVTAPSSTALSSISLTSISRGQLAGVAAAVAAVPVREAQQWGVPGDGEVLHHDVSLLADPDRGVLTGLTGWRLELR